MTNSTSAARPCATSPPAGPSSSRGSRACSRPGASSISIRRGRRRRRRPVRKPEFAYVTYIETTPEKLWEALTSSEFSRRYWFNTDLQSDFKVGSPFALVMNGTTTDVGEILEAHGGGRVHGVGHHVLHGYARNADT